MPNVPAEIAFVDLDLRVQHRDGILAAAHGASTEDCPGRPVLQMGPDIWPQLEPLYRAVTDTGTPVLEQEIRRPDASWPHQQRVWLASCFPLCVESQITGLGAVATDTPVRGQAGEFSPTVPADMAEGLCVLDRASRLVMLDIAAAAMLGRRSHEFIGEFAQAAINFQHADGSPCPKHACRLLLAPRAGGSAHRSDDILTHQAETTSPIAYSVAPLRHGDHIRGAAVVFRDVTRESAE